MAEFLGSPLASVVVLVALTAMLIAGGALTQNFFISHFSG